MWGLLVGAIGCAHVEPEPPPKTMSWKDTALGSAGEPSIDGALEPRMISELVRKHLHKVKTCYERELRRDSSLSGKIVVEFAIANTGEVQRAVARSSTMNNETFDQCVIREVLTWRFPEFQGDTVRVSYPFIFQSASGIASDESDASQGSLDKEIIRAVVRKHTEKIRRCYSVARKRTPRLEAKILVEFSVDGTGRVERAIARETNSGDEVFDNCVVNEVKSWQFPEPEGGGKVNVTYPFIFKPGETW